MNVGASKEPEEPFIPLSVPSLNGNELEYIKDCLDTNWVSYAGSYVDRFEKQLAVEAGSSFAIGMNSGTSALHVALLLAGVGVDDEVVMPGLSFVAPANAVRYCGAWPVFTDIRPDDWQWDLDQVETFLEDGCEEMPCGLVNKATGRRIAALLPVHLLGGMCDRNKAASVASRFNLPLIEDSAECLGAEYRGRAMASPLEAYTGPCYFTATSFNGNKIITTGGGGALFVHEEKWAQAARHLSTTAKADPIEFFHDAVGFNYRMTNMAAAMGVAQLEQLQKHVELKRMIAARYEEAFQSISEITAHPEPAYCIGTFWMYTVRLNQVARPVIDRLNLEGILSRPLWAPLHRLPMYADCYCHGPLVEIEQLSNQALSLPCSVSLSHEDQDRVINSLLEILGV